MAELVLCTPIRRATLGAVPSLLKERTARVASVTSANVRLARRYSGLAGAFRPWWKRSLVPWVPCSVLWALVIIAPAETAAQRSGAGPCPLSARLLYRPEYAYGAARHDDRWEKAVRLGLGTGAPPLHPGGPRRDTRVIDSLWRLDSVATSWHLAQITASSRIGGEEARVAAWHYRRLAIGVTPMLQAVSTAPLTERRFLGLTGIDALTDTSHRRAVLAMACDAASQLAGAALSGREESLPPYWLIHQQGVLEEAHRLLTREDRAFTLCLLATLDSMLAAGRDRHRAALRRFADRAISGWQSCR